MRFDITVSNQAVVVEKYLKRILYKSLHEQVAKRKGVSVLFLGIGAGLGSGSLTVATQIALIFEAIFKGSINVSLACCVKEAVFLTGLKQLFCRLPLEIISCPFSISSAAIGVVSKPFFLMNSPLSYSEKMWLKRDPREKKARVDAEKDAEFKRALGSVTQFPNKVENLKRVGSYYLSGHGIAQDRDKAIEYYTMAASQNDVTSMKTLAEIYDVSRDEEGRAQSLKWYEKAAEANDLEAMHKMGLLCWNLPGRRKEGYDWMTKAAQAGHEPSKDYLKKIR